MKVKMLVIGNFYTSLKGTKRASLDFTKIIDNIHVSITSFKKIRVFQLLEISNKIIFGKYDIFWVEAFSGRSFITVLLVSWLARRKRGKLVIALHGGMLDEFLDNKKRLEQFAFKRAILVSPSKYLIHKFKSRWEVKYLPNFIDEQNFYFSSVPRSGKKLLWIRAFQRFYRPELALRALHEVRVSYPEATLTMIGRDMGQLEYCSRLIEELGLTNHVTIIESVPNNQIVDFYATHDIYLNTTLYESFGLAVVEAMYCGIPVVSSKVGELPHLWQDGEILFFTGDYKGLVDTIISVFRMEVDDKLELVNKAHIAAARLTRVRMKDFYKKSIMSFLDND